jgi:subtilisin-like proprotein convertase family protein
MDDASRDRETLCFSEVLRCDKLAGIDSLFPSSPPVTTQDLSQSGMQTLEHVSVTMTIIHPCRGNVEITLVCPSGMTSLIGARRALDR